MILNDYYWYFQSALPEKVCQQIIDTAKQKQGQVAVTGTEAKKLKQKNKLSKKDLLDLKKYRNSNIVWLDDPWIFNAVQPFIREANLHSGWNFEWSWSETAQFTAYHKNQHYDWHADSWNKPYNCPELDNKHGRIRKLSVTVSLSDPKDYTGGELEFDFRNSKKGNNKKVCKEIRPRGSIVVFPSFVWHRVKPVKSGTRYSLVIWNIGWPFK